MGLKPSSLEAMEERLACRPKSYPKLTASISRKWENHPSFLKRRARPTIAKANSQTLPTRVDLPARAPADDVLAADDPEEAGGAAAAFLPQVVLDCHRPNPPIHRPRFWLVRRLRPR